MYGEEERSVEEERSRKEGMGRREEMKKRRKGWKWRGGRGGRKGGGEGRAGGREKGGEERGKRDWSVLSKTMDFSAPIRVAFKSQQEELRVYKPGTGLQSSTWLCWLSCPAVSSRLCPGHTPLSAGWRLCSVTVAAAPDWTLLQLPGQRSEMSNFMSILLDHQVSQKTEHFLSRNCQRACG